MKNKKSLQNKLDNIKEWSVVIFRYFLYLCFAAFVAYGVYKVFNWKKIFDRDFEVAQIVKRKIDLPPIIKNASSTRVMSYEDQIFLDNIIKKLKGQNIEITQIEETDNDRDVHLLTGEGYRLFLSYEVDQTLLFDNIVSVYTSKDFKSEVASKTTTANASSGLEYVDFRFKDKVFYRFRDSKNYTPVTIVASSSQATTTSSSTGTLDRAGR